MPFYIQFQGDKNDYEREKNSTINIVLLICIILLGILIGCRNKVKNNSFIQKAEAEIVVNRDSIYSGDFVRGVVFLKKSSFSNNEAKILVYLENSEEPKLKTNLANLEDLEFNIFENFSKDSVNQKFFPNYPKNLTAAFGKKFLKKGLRKIKGFVLEYYGFNPVNEPFKENQFKRYYFEKEIYVQ